MKKIKSIAVVFAISVVLSGCTDSPTSYNTSSSNQIFKKIEEKIIDSGSISNHDVPGNLQIVILYETDYGKAVCKLADPYLQDENFELWNYPTHPDTIFTSIYNRYKYLPLEKWPIICIPTPNFEAISDLIASRYPKLAVVMPYINISSWFPNTKNYPANKIFNVILVGGGNQLNDWTKGNKLDFIDSVRIQYVNPTPQIIYPISNVANVGGYTRVYNSVLPYYASVGSQVWFNILGSSGNFYQRFCVLEKSTTEGWVKIYQQNIGDFQSGTAKSHYLSGATFSNGAYINRIMRDCSIDFPTAVKLARRTASNNGIRNDSTGFGRINSKAAIISWLPWVKTQ